MKKSLLTSIMAVSAALCLCVTAQAQDPVVTTDQPDYAPGTTAVFSVSGFQANELVDFSVAVADDSGTWVPDIAWADIPADASGGANVSYVVPDTWLGKTLQLTVMGLSSSLMATTTFTDANATHNVNFAAAASVPDLGPGFPATSISINGTKVPPGTPNTAHAFGPDTFITPASSNPAEGTKPSTELTFSGYPTAPINVVGGHYTLTSFTLGPVGTQNGTLHDPSVATGSGQYTTGDDNTGMGKKQSTIVGNYTFVADVVNHAPLISPQSEVDNDLGPIVGCLDNGVISTSVAVAYSVEQVDTKNFNVFATFNGDTANKKLIGTVNDVDGNLALSGITLNPTSQTLTFTGPGSHTLDFSTSVTATDTGTPPLSAGPTACPTIGKATVEVIYNFNGFFPPLDNNSVTLVKLGSTVPVKFQITDCSGTPIGTGIQTISVMKLVAMVPSGTVDVSDAGASNDNGIDFRYDPTGMQWIYNLQTKMGYIAGCTYQITATLDDGTTHLVSIGMKK